MPERPQFPPPAHSPYLLGIEAGTGGFDFADQCQGPAMNSASLILSWISFLNAKVDRIMATQAELAASLTALTAQVVKTRGEVIAAVSSLEAALAAAGTTSPEVDAALAELRTAVQSVDDLNPDAA